MKKKENVIDKNYLEFIPERNSLLTWKTDKKGIVTLDVENTGFFNRSLRNASTARNTPMSIWTSLEVSSGL